MPKPIDVTVLVPVYNEEQSLAPLLERVREHLKPTGKAFEILFVDDGSTDGSGAVLRRLAEEASDVRVLRLPVNMGKAEALNTGFRHVRGDVVITMDADLQDDPAELPRFIETLEQGYDLVSGWKKERHDPWHKTLPSKLFNAVVSKTFRLPLHDFNCGYKAYRRKLIERMFVYGELHRYLPVLAQSLGARITEIAVQHHARPFGHSKYGAGRLIKGFLDMITVLFLTRFLKRPLHFFGTGGLIGGGLGGLMLTYLGVLWLCGVRPIGNRPLLFYGMVLLIMGIQFISLGILSELMLYFFRRNDREAPAEQIGFDEADE